MGNAIEGTITRRMNYNLNGLEREFGSLYSKDYIKYKIAALEKFEKTSARASKLQELYAIFNKCGIRYEKEKDASYYEQIVGGANLPENFKDIEKKMLLALFSRFQVYPSPEIYMKRIVDSLCTTEDNWPKDNLRTRILKQFIKYGNYLKDANYGGQAAITSFVEAKIKKRGIEKDEILLNLDDEVFSLLEGANKEKTEPKGKYGLIKLADDLSAGKFRGNGSTKKGLYYFAMVYGMTYHLGNSGDIIGYRTDIEKNLFSDYYTNNLMRYIDDYYKAHTNEFDKPSGQGINYKNFAEMIYLYYICKEEYSPEDKIRLSSQMIARVRGKECKDEETLENKKSFDTEFYRNFFKKDSIEDLFSESILSLGEKEFEEFICRHYDCGSKEIGPLQVKKEQGSAFREYQSIKEGLVKLCAEFKNCNYGLWFTDVDTLKKACKRFFENGAVPDNENRINDFINLLMGADKILKDTKSLSISSAKEVTRTHIVVAYYYYYNALHERNHSEDSIQMSFEEFFNDFRSGIDEKLEKVHYQPICGKNIFDVLVAFSSYAYLYY